MAILFDDVDNQELRNTSSPIATEPLSMACWFQTDSASLGQTLISIADVDLTNRYWALYASGNRASDPISAISRTGGTNVFGDSSTGYSINTWHHAAGIFPASGVSRSGFIDGGSKGTESTTAVVASTDQLGIGRTVDSSPGAPLSGRGAEVAIWNIDLSDAEVVVLGLSYSALFVRPGNLVHYDPMIRADANDDTHDIIGGLTMVGAGDTGVPTTVSHPPIIYPSEDELEFIVAAVGGAAMINLAGYGGLASPGGYGMLAGKGGGLVA